MLQNIKLIFTSTTGRSGTRYLANIINKNAVNATAEHDPYPRGYGKPIVWYDTNQKDKLHSLVRKKLNRINRGNRIRIDKDSSRLLLKSSKNKKEFALYVPRVMMLQSYFPTVDMKEIYLESTHAFIKSFAESIVSLHSDINIIHLTRDPLEVAKSFFNRNSIPGRNNPYLLSPDYKKNQLQIPFSMNNFQKCLWYWFESELRHQQFIEKYPDIKCYDIDIKTLNNSESLRKLFHFFGILYDDFIFNVDQNKNIKSTVISKSDLNDAKQLIDIIPDSLFVKIKDTYKIRERLSIVT